MDHAIKRIFTKYNLILIKVSIIFHIRAVYLNFPNIVGKFL